VYQLVCNLTRETHIHARMALEFLVTGVQISYTVGIILPLKLINSETDSGDTLDKIDILNEVVIQFITSIGAT